MRSSSSSSDIARASSSRSDNSSKFLISGLSLRPLLGQDGQAQGPLDVKVEPPDFLECSIEQRAAARFEGHDEGQGRVWIARFLQKRVNTDSKPREYRGHFRHDAGTVSHDKAHVMRDHEIAAHRLRILG